MRVIPGGGGVSHVAQLAIAMAVLLAVPQTASALERVQAGDCVRGETADEDVGASAHRVLSRDTPPGNSGLQEEIASDSPLATKGGTDTSNWLAMKEGSYPYSVGKQFMGHSAEQWAQSELIGGGVGAGVGILGVLGAYGLAVVPELFVAVGTGAGSTIGPALPRLGQAVPRWTQFLGQQIGKLGTLVRNPGITIQGFRGAANPGHALNQIINRGVSPQSILNTIHNPQAVFQQWGGERFLYVGKEAALTVTRGGQVVTMWARSEFTPAMIEALQTIGIMP